MGAAVTVLRGPGVHYQVNFQATVACNVWIDMLHGQEKSIINVWHSDRVEVIDLVWPQ